MSMVKNSLRVYVMMMITFGFAQNQKEQDPVTADSLQMKFADMPSDTLTAAWDRGGIWQNFKYDAAAMGGGFVHTFTQPARWQKDDFLKFGAVVGGVMLLYTVDQQTSDYFVDQSEEVPQLLKDAGWYFGSPQINYAFTGGIYTIGLLTDNAKLRQTGVLMITSASVAGLIQQVSKTVTGRARPYTDLGKNHFKPFGGSADYRSFPSGHTVLSVTSLYALSKQFDNKWLKGGCYVLAAVAPMSRLWEGAHWLTDVALSTALSIAVVESVDHYLKDGEKYQHDPLSGLDKHKVKWRLVAGPTQVGLLGQF